MELKAKLNKPYTDGARMAFYADNVQVNGYKLIETEEALEAWGYTTEEAYKVHRRAEILARLNEIDSKSIRALRANDTEYIQMYEEEAIALREELKSLDD